MTMHVNEFKKLFSAAMEDEAFRAVFQEKTKKVVEAAVAEAVATKDAELRELKEELAETKMKLNDLEQYSRRLCINVSGIPERSDESTDQLVTDIAKMAGVTVTPEDIDRTHRVGTKRDGQHRTIIARLTNFSKRQELYDARRKLRTPKAFPGSTVTQATAESAFISDNLTRDNQLTLYKARQLKKERKIFAAWSDVGKLKVRVREGGPTVHIRSERDLLALVNSPASGAVTAASSSSTDNSDGYTKVVTRSRGGRS